MKSNKKEQSKINCPKEKLDATKIKTSNVATSHIHSSKIRSLKICLKRQEL